jgi:hypothetical protein
MPLPLFIARGVAFYIYFLYIKERRKKNAKRFFFKARGYAFLKGQRKKTQSVFF